MPKISSSVKSAATVSSTQAPCNVALQNGNTQSCDQNGVCTIKDNKGQVVQTVSNNGANLGCSPCGAIPEKEVVMSENRLRIAERVIETSLNFDKKEPYNLLAFLAFIALMEVNLIDAASDYGNCGNFNSSEAKKKAKAATLAEYVAPAVVKGGELVYIGLMSKKDPNNPLTNEAIFKALCDNFSQLEKHVNFPGNFLDLYFMENPSVMEGISLLLEEPCSYNDNLSVLKCGVVNPISLQ